MVKYVQYKNNNFIELEAGSTVCYNTVPISVEKAAEHSELTSVYTIEDYDSTKVYPANFELVEDVLTYEFIPIDWKYQSKRKRVFASQYLLFSELGSNLSNFLTIASLRGLPIDLNDEEFISIVYLNTFSPVLIGDYILSLKDKYYKMVNEFDIEISDTKVDDTWNCVYGDPHETGLIVIDSLDEE